MELNRKRSQLQAYFAGVFDGEGYVGINRSASTYNCKACIAMDDPQAVALLALEYPEAQFTHRIRAENGKRYWVVNFSHYKSERFLREILPFSLIKAEQIKVTLAFLAHRRRDHSPTKGFNCGGRCQQLLDKCKTLKQSTKGVNSVNLPEMREYRAEPEHVAADQEHINSLLKLAWERVETSAEDATVQ